MKGEEKIKKDHKNEKDIEGETKKNQKNFTKKNNSEEKKVKWRERGKEGMN